MTPNEKAKSIIDTNLYLSLATSLNNETWISPLWYATDENYNFYFVSEYESKHAKFIKENPNVAVSIFNSTEVPEDVNGLQIEATAGEVKIMEIPGALVNIFKKSGADLFKLRFKDWNNPASYSNLSKFRIYKIVPKKFFILDTTVVETDKRIEVSPKDK